MPCIVSENIGKSAKKAHVVVQVKKNQPTGCIKPFNQFQALFDAQKERIVEHKKWA